MTVRTPEFFSGFHSWAVKLKRADEHLDWLNAEFQWFREGHPYKLVSEHDPESRKNIFRCEQMDSIPLKWSAVIGECVNGYRSALDHIVYFIAEAHGVATDRTEFPIYVEPEKYRLARSQKIGGLPDKMQAFIDEAQPKDRTYWLWVLRDLANMDKHKRIHLTSTILAGSRIRIRDTFINFPAGRALESGTELARFGDDDLRSLGIDPASINPEVDMAYEFAIDIAFADAESATGLQVRHSLRSIRDHVRAVIEGLKLWLPPPKFPTT